MSEAFDSIPYSELEQPFSILGTGSFGSVYKSIYLGLPVALKQVNPSTNYDVRKYFEREWRLMREARHPNVVLYLGLSHAPDGQVYIVSEFVEGGNLRSYIYNKRKPFPWRMRVSFATDIARALAYLHARKCIHRDLKPENLLLTSNGRVKITDFGFARIAPRSQDEIRRLTFCGTDAYMSPEILLGESFGISTDIFSLGVIFAEILSRTLADDHHLKRTAPSGWVVDPNEVWRTASEGAPEGFVRLAIECMQGESEKRPTMGKVLEVLRSVESEIAERGEEDAHVGTIKFATGGKRRPGMAPRIPSFGKMVQEGGDAEPLKIDTTKDTNANRMIQDEDDEDTDDEDLEAVLGELELNLQKAGPPGMFGVEEGAKEQPYSTHVIRGPSTSSNMSSVMTVKPDSPRVDDQDANPPLLAGSAMSVDSYRTAPESSAFSIAVATIGDNDENEEREREVPHSTIRTLPKPIPIPAVVPEPRSGADGPLGESLVPNSSSTSSLMFHRFTMIKPGTKRHSVGALTSGGVNRPASHTHAHAHAHAHHTHAHPKGVGKRHSIVDSLSWSPFDFLLGRSRKQSLGSSSASGSASGGSKPGSGSTTPIYSHSQASGQVSTKCDLCGKRLGVGYKTILECDDCGLRVHVKCAEFSPSDCGLRVNNRTMATSPAGKGPSLPTK